MGKRLKSFGIILASLLLWAGCVLPQNDDPLPAIPPERNNRPRIISNLLVPLLNISLAEGSSGNCGNALPIVKVEDLDLGDRIQGKWVPSTLEMGPPSSAPIDSKSLDPVQSPATSPIRSGAFTFPKALLAVAPFNRTGNHRLDLLVTDSSFNVQPDNITPDVKITYTLPDGTALNEFGGLDTYTWSVKVQQDCP